MSGHSTPIPNSLQKEVTQFAGLVISYPRFKCHQCWHMLRAFTKNLNSATILRESDNTQSPLNVLWELPNRLPAAALQCTVRSLLHTTDKRVVTLCSEHSLRNVNIEKNIKNQYWHFILWIFSLKLSYIKATGISWPRIWRWLCLAIRELVSHGGQTPRD